MFKWFGLIVFIATPLVALDYAIEAKRATSIPIKKFAIYSERCSGSNYMEHLIEKNIQIPYIPFGHKHFPPWFFLSASKWKGDPAQYSFKGTDDYLFIIIYRDPYKWLQSFCRQPHHSDKSLRKMPFSKFIRSRWVLDKDDSEIKQLKKNNKWIDKNPNKKRHFNNVMELRSAKIQNMLQIKQKANNVYIVNYEVIRDHPKEVLKELAGIYELNLNPLFHSISSYRGNPNFGNFEKKNDSPISKSDLEYINRCLDWTLEKQIGYEPAS